MAETQFGSVSEGANVQQDASASTVILEQNPSHDTQQEIVRVKRMQVLVACRRCRQRKTKCDALRPCTPCARRNLTCQYDAQDGETHSQASKRKYEEAIRSHDAYAEVFYILGNKSERDAVEVLSWIRSGYRPEEVLRLITSGNVAIATTDPRQLVLEDFLVNLAHSTGTIQDIIRLAMAILDPSAGVRLPQPLEFLKLRNRIVHIHYMEELMQQPLIASNSIRPLLLGGAIIPSQEHIQDSLSTHRDSAANYSTSKDNPPPHQVPAVPWTTITTSDEAVSHLVSLFLAWVNPTWRFVEQDLFLLGMHSKWPHSNYCSPFLVNSICAIASLHSEHEVAMVPGDRNRIHRGQHFHDEALRLWAHEDNRPTLTNVQALCILSLESNYRAKDKLGLTLVPIAVHLDNEIPIHGDETQLIADGVSERDFARVRLNTHWMVICTHIIMRIAFMSGTEAETKVTRLPNIHQVFDDRVEAWIGYPLVKDVVLFRPTLYLRERCRLAGLFQEMYDLVIANNHQHYGPTRTFAKAVDDLSEKILHWYKYLPFELQYEWPMSVAVWELHASYLAVHMTLWVAARTQFQQNQVSSVEDSPSAEFGDEDVKLRSQTAQDMLSKAIKLGHRAAQILREFRKRYGLKITPAWLLQLQAVAAGVLLQDPELNDPTLFTPSQTNDFDDTINDSRTAFDEVFRGLLGTGVQVMVARGIARMMYHTALQLKIVLSHSTRSMLQIMSDTAWRPSDLSLVNSSFPNYATTKGHLDSSERMTELLMKWETLDI